MKKAVPVSTAGWTVILFYRLLLIPLLHHTTALTNALSVFGSLSTTSRTTINTVLEGRHSFSTGSTGRSRWQLDVLMDERIDHSAATHYSNNKFFLVMGKGDGKKKRKKKPATPSSPAAAAAPAEVKIQQPLRVTNDINIPVKRQIRYAQMTKEFQRQQRANPGFRQKKVVRTRYRRTWDEEEIQEKKEERKKRGQDPNWDVILNQTKSSPLVVCHVQCAVQRCVCYLVPYLIFCSLRLSDHSIFQLTTTKNAIHQLITYD